MQCFVTYVYLWHPGAIYTLIFHPGILLNMHMNLHRLLLLLLGFVGLLLAHRRNVALLATHKAGCILVGTFGFLVLMSTNFTLVLLLLSCRTFLRFGSFRLLLLLLSRADDDRARFNGNGLLGFCFLLRHLLNHLGNTRLRLGLAFGRAWSSGGSRRGLIIWKLSTRDSIAQSVMYESAKVALERQAL